MAMTCGACTWLNYSGPRGLSLHPVEAFRLGFVPAGEVQNTDQNRFSILLKDLEDYNLLKHVVDINCS